VLAERPAGPSTRVVLVRPDVSSGAGRDLERRLLAHRLAGSTTIVVVVTGEDRVSGSLISSLLRAERKIGARNGRLVVAAESRESRVGLESAGLELVDLTDPGPVPAPPPVKAAGAGR
jgi:anti-anti-sigma regulatory factor